MKTIKFFIFTLLVFLTSCQEENNFIRNNELSDNDIVFISKNYKVKVSKTKENEKNLTFSTREELFKNLDLMKKVNTDTLYLGLDKILTNEDIIVNNKTLDSLLTESKKKIVLKTNTNNSNPPSEYSVTFYFDNNFPCSNVYITINYSVDSNGNITGASVTSGSWGYAYGNTYNQTNSVVSIHGSYIVFSATGQFSTSMGLGSFSFTNQNTANYTGYLFIPRGNNGGSTGGFCRQTPNDHTTEAEN